MFETRAFRAEGSKLRAMDLEVMQVNIGLTCNLKCVHCHVAAGPRRTEQMNWETMRDVLAAAQQGRCKLIDITGGAPEMNPHFRDFVRAIHALGIPIAAGVLFPLTGWLLSPIIAAAAMALSSVSVIGNALRLNAIKL